MDEGVMSTDHQLMLWNSNWAVVSGVVICTGCLRSQQLSEAENAFVHDTACRTSEVADTHPWTALHLILDTARG